MLCTVLSSHWYSNRRFSQIDLHFEGLFHKEKSIGSDISLFPNYRYYSWLYLKEPFTELATAGENIASPMIQFEDIASKFRPPIPKEVICEKLTNFFANQSLVNTPPVGALGYWHFICWKSSYIQYSKFECFYRSVIVLQSCLITGD